MNKNIVIAGIVLLVLIGGFILLGNNSSKTSENKKDLSALIPPDQMTEKSIDTIANQNKDTQQVVIVGHKIQNTDLTVPVGTTVVFENRDSFAGLPYDAHTVTTGSVDPSGKTGLAGKVPNSGSGVADGIINEPLKKGGTYSYTFDSAGEVTFYVEEHPLVSGQGTITITATDSVAEDTSVIQMNSGSFFFAPNTLQAKVGEEVNIDITSSGLHTFTIDELGIDVPTQDSTTTRVTFTPDTAGTYTYYCAIPGHTEAGQIGSLVVTE